MTQFWAIFADTVREARDRRMVLLMAGITIAFLAFALIVLKVQPQEEGKIAMTTLFSDSPRVMEAGDFVKQSFAGLFMTNQMLFLFLFILMFSFFIPNLLQPGTLDLHLSKPISRWRLMAYKCAACNLFAVLAIFLCMSLYWAALCVKAGYWGWHPFAELGMLSATFVIGFSIPALFGVLNRGAGGAIAVYYVYVMLICNLLEEQTRNSIAKLLDSETLRQALDALYYISPKITECAGMTADLMIGRGNHGGASFDWFPLWSSALSALALYVLACFAFTRKDY